MRFTLLLILSLFTLTSIRAQTKDSSYYERGMDFYNSGDINSALQTWIDAFNEIEDSSLIDPRIGSSFIEIVAKNKLTTLYQASTMLYYWSLSSTGKGEFEEYLTKEILKSEAIFDQFEFKKYKNMLKHELFSVSRIVKQKWLSLDPTSGSRTNERLIEHWERIAYSKENFTKASNTIFGTDDRANLYIKFGKPGLIYKGTLDYNSGVIHSSISTVLNTNSNEVKDLIDDTLMSYYPADYEIWVYPFLSERGRFVKIFGDKYTTLSFQEIEVITDFIPAYAFNKSQGVSKPGATYTPGFFLLYNYLQQLSTFDSYFSSQFVELNEVLAFPNQGITSKPVSTDANWVFPQVRSAAADMNRIVFDAPAEESSYLKALDDIEIQVRDFKYFDEVGRPVTFYVMNSYPLYRMLDYMVKDERTNLEDYLLSHSLSLVNNTEISIETINDSPSLPFLTKKIVHPAQSIFKILDDKKDLELVFSVQLYDELETNKPSDNILPKSLKATGGYTFNETEARKTNTEFELSDIMIGYQFDKVNLEDEITFLVSIDNKIPDFSNLFLHFQTINLQLNEEGKTNLNIELSVKQKKSVLGFFRRNKTNSISFNYQDRSTQIRENLEFELVDRNPGNYELTIRVTDENSKSYKTKKIDFEIINTE